MAQLVEQRSPKPQVGGSSPSARAQNMTNAAFFITSKKFSTNYDSDQNMIASIKSTIADVTKEMKKVSWPTKQQLSESTVVVITTCAILTLFVWVIDIAMAWLNQTIF